MTGLIRFLQNSVDEIHNSLKKYTKRTLVIRCQGCNNHVVVRVLDLLTEPRESTEIECERCGCVVCFTAGREHTTPRPGPGPHQAIYHDQSRALAASLVGDDLGQSVSDPHVRSNQDISTGNSSGFTPTKSSHVYGNLDSTCISDYSLHESFEDQNSMSGQCSSYRSSISLPRKPSQSQSRLNMLGLEQCCEKTGTSRNSWNIVSASLYSTDSPIPSIASISQSHPSLSLFSDEKPLKPDDSAIFMELEKSEDGCAFELSVSRRNSGDSRSSIDLTSGRVIGPGTVGRVDSDSDSVRVSDPDTINVRGSIISDKRRGKMPMRSNAIHRRAVSRRHSLKIEQEEQDEAETLSAKRRNSVTTDFDVEPSDEEIRQAYKIYTEASQQQSPHPESDIQWARVILRRRKNWEHMRYEHPLRSSTEQLQLKPRNNIESAASPRPSGLVHQPLPLLTIQPNMSPKISTFSFPTPVKEESEGDVMSLGSPEYSSSQPVPGSLVGGFGSPKPLEPPNAEPEKPSSLPSAVSISERVHPNGPVQTPTTGADTSVVIRPESKSTRTRFKKALRNVTSRISYFHEGRFSPPPPHSRLVSADSTKPMADVVEPPSHQRSRLSGEIQDVPTSEEPFIRVGNEISALVEGMTSPSIEIQFHARAEDLFPARFS